MTRSQTIAPLNPGDTLGGFQLLMAVGTGGMGRVWAARRVDAPGQCLVALKTALEEMANDEQFERMLLDEARIAASIIHPNVCAISEVGAEKGIPYLVMDWMDAGTLLDLLLASPNHRLDYFLAARIFSDVAAGLHAAHELTGPDGVLLNVVHRDVSPQNILLSSAGHVKVADFGVAKARGQLHAPTVTGEVKGKLSYMSPEQLTSKIFDRRADVFALGCCLYEATTGVRPYHGNDALETMYKLLESACDPPSIIVEDYPKDLEKIVLRALEKAPERRYQSADELRVALGGFLAQHGKLITDREISSLVRARLAEPLERKAHALEEATRGISRSQSSALKPRAEATVRSVDTPRTWTTHRPDAVRRMMLRWGVLAISAASISLFAWYRWPNSHPAPAPKSAALAATPATAASSVTITLQSEPSSAAIRIDDGPALKSPQVIVSYPSQVLHSVTVTEDGYETGTRQIAFDHSQEILIGLKRLTIETHELPKVAPKEPRLAPSRQPPLPSAEVPAIEQHSTKPKRPKRPIDRDNPFSDP